MAFFFRPAAKQALRRASLILQRTGGLEAMASSTNKEGEPPQIVSFVKGDGHTLVMHRLRRMFDVVRTDPLLELAPATSNLLATIADLVL